MYIWTSFGCRAFPPKKNCKQRTKGLFTPEYFANGCLNLARRPLLINHTGGKVRQAFVGVAVLLFSQALQDLARQIRSFFQELALAVLNKKKGEKDRRTVKTQSGSGGSE